MKNPMGTCEKMGESAGWWANGVGIGSELDRNGDIGPEQTKQHLIRLRTRKFVG